MTGRVEVVAHVWDAEAQAFRPAAERRAKFLKGPVPWAWIEVTAKLPGQALAVGLVLWRLRGATNSRVIRLGNADLGALGIKRSAKSRALASLKQAGLIAVDQLPGRLPVVTILDVECPTGRTQT